VIESLLQSFNRQSWCLPACSVCLAQTSHMCCVDVHAYSLCILQSICELNFPSSVLSVQLNMSRSVSWTLTLRACSS